MQELEELRGVRELVEALPEAAAAALSAARRRTPQELDGYGARVFLAHRWQVEQVTCVFTSYSAASLRPSSSWLDGARQEVL